MHCPNLLFRLICLLAYSNRIYPYFINQLFEPLKEGRMRAKGAWTIQSLLACFALNSLLAGSFLLMTREIIGGLHKWVDPFLKVGEGGLPPDVHSAFLHLDQFLRQIEQFDIPVILGPAALITLILWLLVLFLGRSFARKAVKESAAGVQQTVEAPREEEKAVPEIKPSEPSRPNPQPAVQILSILQREGRLIDFLNEDLSLYEDAQIGAAVRSVHEGCKKALVEHAELSPVFDEPEGEEVTVPPGFDASAVRLTGNVTGDPPFKGILRHKGWVVSKMDLPRQMTEKKQDWVLAPAEVEIGG